MPTISRLYRGFPIHRGVPLKVAGKRSVSNRPIADDCGWAKLSKVPQTPPPEVVITAPISPHVSAERNEREVYGPTEVPRPQSDCPQTESNEIVVCAPSKVDDPARDRLGPPISPSPTAMEQLSKKLQIKLGPVDANLASGATRSGSPWVGVRLKMKF